jgi:UDP-N-acetyl-D-galactosamine dehydrogenase
MGVFIANKIIKLMIQQSMSIKNAPILVLGITFKENCPDIRNSKVIDVITELQDFGASVEIYDPWASAEEVNHEYGVNLIQKPDKQYSAIVLAVAHKEFKEIDLAALKHEKTVVYDIKSFLPNDLVTARL